MDAIIERYDLKKGTEKLKTELQEQLSGWADEKRGATASKKMVLNALSVVQKKVCVADFPTFESVAGQMAILAFSHVSDCVDYLISEKQCTPQDFHAALLDFLLQLLQCAGPGTTHLQLVTQVFGGSAQFQEYIQTLKGDSVKKILSVCRREFKSGKEKISFEKYADMVKDAMRCVLFDGFTNEQCQEHRKDFLDLYIYFRYGFTDRKEEERKLMFAMSNWIRSHLDFNPFQTIKDKTIFAAFFKRMSEIIFAKSFPPNGDAIDLMKKALEDLLDALKKDGTLTDVYEELMNFTADLFSQKEGRNVHILITEIGDYFSRVKEAHVKGNEQMFEYMCKKLAVIVDETKDISLLEIHFVQPLMKEVLLKAMSSAPAHVTLLIQLIQTLLKRPSETTLSSVYETISEQEDTLKWKDHLSEAKEVFVTISKSKVSKGDSQDDVIVKYMEVFKEFLEQLKRARVLNELTDDLVMFCFDVLENKNKELYQLGQNVAERIKLDTKKNKELVMLVFRRLDTLLQDKSYPWLESTDLYCFITHLCSRGMEAINRNNKPLEEADYRVLVSIIKTVSTCDFIQPDTGEAGGVYYDVFTVVLPFLIRMLDDTDQMLLAKPMLSNIIELLSHELESVRDIVGMMMDLLGVAGQKSADIVGPFMDKLVKAFLQDEKHALVFLISNCYTSNPEPVNDHFQELMEHHDSGDQMVRMHILQLYVAVAKIHSEVLTGKKLQDPLQKAKNNQNSTIQVYTGKNLQELLQQIKKDEHATVQVLMLMEDVARNHVEKMVEVLPQLLQSTFIHYAQPALINVLKEIGLRSSEKHAEMVLHHFGKILDGPDEQTNMLCALDGLRNVGGKHLSLLDTHRPLIHRVQRKTHIQYIKDGCSGLIDMIEGRSLAGLSEDIKETQEEVVELDSRVKGTESDVKETSKAVKLQQKEIKTVKKDVKIQSKKVKKLDKTVDETVAKVEEIDGKTLSHAPFWARDVSKLLNPKDEHDWRLLASRLGYSNDDVRGWAQQHDPCMSMLNEWYATRKTSEATFAVLTALQEMNRMDATVIVENAMKMAETVVEDEEFDYPTPPEVFLSYQWGIQNEVKLLKQHLEKAGFTCWMDIGQMGGGDKLFEKIDKGIRGAKLVISCVTEKYAKSPNCNREVNLSVSLGRPIIPLLMEKQTWPPAGSMGPIFSEYLFIRFFTRPGEETGDQKYWSAAKFQELLMQLNYNGIVPDESKVDTCYKKWWVPVVEEIKIEKKKETGKHQPHTTPTENKEVSTSVPPDVFISYQWGKQKQVLLLYRRLSSLGLTCWMDIFQMGGGDSLYDKIDRGVRGCRVVLSCVTSKYSLSANCRREVSLADALKKPIIPLLLEKITWPPSGPMSMIFTQLLYINFSKDAKVQEHWTGKEFDELMSKIQSYNHSIKGNEANTKNNNDKQEGSKQSVTVSKSTAGVDSYSQSKSNQKSLKSGTNQHATTKQPEVKMTVENIARENCQHNLDSKSQDPQKSKSCVLL